MNKRIKRRIALGVFAFVLLSSIDASAATWVFSNWRYVLKVYPSGFGYYFFLDGAILNPNSCSTVGSNSFVLNETDPNYYGKVSGLLAAFSAGKQVNIVYDAASTDCWTPVDRFIVLN